MTLHPFHGKSMDINFFGVKILDTKSILENEICEALLIILRMKETDADFTVSGRQLPLNVLYNSLWRFSVKTSLQPPPGPKASSYALKYE